MIGPAIGPAAAPQLDHWYPCFVVEVIDGDTLAVSIDCGFYVNLNSHLRLLGLNAPELRTVEGKQARTFTQSWVIERTTENEAHQSWPFAVRFAGVDKYGGRFDGVLVSRADNACLNDALLESGNAVVMKG